MHLAPLVTFRGSAFQPCSDDEEARLPLNAGANADDGDDKGCCVCARVCVFVCIRRKAERLRTHCCSAQ